MTRPQSQTTLRRPCCDGVTGAGAGARRSNTSSRAHPRKRRQRAATGSPGSGRPDLRGEPACPEPASHVMKGGAGGRWPLLFEATLR